MSLWIKLHRNVVLAPGTSAVERISKHIEKLRITDEILVKDTYLGFILTKEKHCWLSLYRCSSGSLIRVCELLRAGEEEDELETDFSDIIRELVNGIHITLELRERELSNLSKKNLLNLVARNILQRRMWEEVICIYDRKNHTVRLNRDYALLKQIGLSSGWINDLLDE